MKKWVSIQTNLLLRIHLNNKYYAIKVILATNYQLSRGYRLNIMLDSNDDIYWVTHSFIVYVFPIKTIDSIVLIKFVTKQRIVCSFEALITRPAIVSKRHLKRYKTCSPIEFSFVCYFHWHHNYCQKLIKNK